MAVYWCLFAYFAVGAVSAGVRKHLPAVRWTIPYVLGALIIVVLVGMRYEVGADWETYEFIYERAGPLQFFDALELGDPGYQALNWASYQIGGEIWVVNLACAGIFATGLVRFCATLPAPWAALLVAIPYMGIVVAMGYTRQGAALGILMMALAVFLRGGSLMRVAAYVFVAAMFHRTAVIGFPLMALAMQRNRAVNLVLVAAMSMLMYDFFIAEQLEDFVDRYIEARYSSQGAAIRVGMNLVPAAVFWTLRGRLGFSQQEYALWRNFSLAAIAMAFLLVILPSSTAVDRMAIYVMPLQLGVLCRLALFSGSGIFGSLMLVGYAVLVQFVWFNFAQHARFWVPYQFFPI